MTNEELIAYLKLQGLPKDVAAADRIEELESRNKELTLQLLATSGQAADALDKLTKAMAGLRKIADHKHFSLDQGWIQNTEARIASAVLAELGGGK